MAKAPILAACLAAALTASAAFAQSADKPLGDILDVLEQPAPPAPKSVPFPIPADGIAPTAIPPSDIGQVPFGPGEPPDEFAEPDAPTVTMSGPVPPSEEERLAAEAAAAEKARLEELDRRRTARVEAARLAQEQAAADHRRQVEAHEAAVATAQAEYQAELERVRVQAERDRAAWLARVRACEEGNRKACLQPGE